MGHGGQADFFLEKSLDNIIVLISDKAFTVCFFSVLWHAPCLDVMSGHLLTQLGLPSSSEHPGRQHCLILVSKVLFSLSVFPRFLQFQVPRVRGVRQQLHSLGLALRGTKIISSCSRRGLG